MVGYERFYAKKPLRVAIYDLSTILGIIRDILHRFIFQLNPQNSPARQILSPFCRLKEIEFPSNY